MAVPLTAATQSIVASQVLHQDLIPPWSLTASDGSGLALARVEAKAVVEGPLAYTELHLWFHNPEARRREGTFQITLPEHAAVSRFAMETDGHFMEAEVVERQLARRAYDDFLHRRQDPALLEKAEGNQFTAKVFPIAANADKHIVISYSQELPSSRYTLPLRGLPNTAQIDVTVTSNGQVGQTLSKRAWTPDRDFIADAPASAQAVGAGNLVAIRVAAVAENAPAEPPRAMTLLIDTSASRALGYAGYVRSVRALIEKVATSYGGSLPIEVVAFDQDRQTIYRGAASGWGDAEDQRLVERGAAGASDLAQAVRGVASKSRLVVVTDGVITAGAEHAELVAAVKATKAERVDVVLAGGLRDDAAAAELVRAGTEHAGAVLDLDDGAGVVATALAQPVRVEIPVAVAGAAWVYPTTIASARAGTSTMVFARLARPAVSTVDNDVDLIVGNEHRHVTVQAAEQPLVERAVGGARIEELEAQLAAAPAATRDALRQQIAHESVADRVISSQTSLLVLESANDYARYGIDQKSLADVLVVGAHGLERMHQELPKQVELVAPAQNENQIREHDSEKGKQKAENSERKEIAGKDLEDGKPARMTGDGDKTVADHDVTGANGTTHAGPMGGEALAEPEKLEDPRAMPATTPTLPAPVAAMPPPPPPAETTTNRPAQGQAGVAASGRGFTSTDHFVAQAQIAQNQTVTQAAAPDAWPPAGSPVALTGELATIEQALAGHHVDDALVHARDWHAKEPGNVLALIGLGDALEANGSATTAARVYGSIIDLYPGRADMRRFAGERLARLIAASAKHATTDLVLDTYRRAVADRPDHLTGHRLLAYALVRAGKPAEAFDAILAAIDQPYRNDSYLGGMRVLGDDAGMIGATLIAARPEQRAIVMAALQKHGLQLATTASTRFILYWETDANDVDFHIQDAKGGHAYFAAKQLASGGELYADITTGYGPECFAIQGTPKAGPYKLSINYYSQGPMGYGMGLLEIQKFDGHGGLSFEDRPYVIMNDHAFVDLGAF
ncbi:MAG: VIT domain-containing protein [Deltaproteobacteria bacterium]